VLFADLIAAERADGRRMLVDNAGAVAFVPYFARYAYETYVAPKETYPNLAEVPDGGLTDLAEALSKRSCASTTCGSWSFRT